MIVSAAVMMMLMAPAADPVAKARQEFSACLDRFTTDALDRKMAADQFNSALQPKCAEKEKAFRDILRAANKADGMKDAEAAEDVDMQVSEYLDKFKGQFEDYSKN